MELSISSELISTLWRWRDLLAADSKEHTKEGYVARHVRVAGQIVREPRFVLQLVRSWMLKLWQAKGAGFYGLGYVAVFVSLEVRSLTGDLGGSDGVSGFLAGQVLDYLLRISIESFMNGVFALIWPLHVFLWLEVWAIPVLALAFLVFERYIRPKVESWFPELNEAELDETSGNQPREGS